MSDLLYPTTTNALAQRRKALTPDAEEVFKVFSQTVFADGALDAKTKQLIAVARPCHPVPLSHQGLHEGGTAA